MENSRNFPKKKKKKLFLVGFSLFYFYLFMQRDRDKYIYFDDFVLCGITTVTYRFNSSLFRFCYLFCCFFVRFLFCVLKFMCKCIIFSKPKILLYQHLSWIWSLSTFFVFSMFVSLIYTTCVPIL